MYREGRKGGLNLGAYQTVNIVSFIALFLNLLLPIAHNVPTYGPNNAFLYYVFMFGARNE